MFRGEAFHASPRGLPIARVDHVVDELVGSRILHRLHFDFFALLFAGTILCARRPPFGLFVLLVFVAVAPISTPATRSKNTRCHDPSVIV